MKKKSIRQLGPLVAGLFVLLGLGAASSQAATITDQRPLLFSFDASDTDLNGFDTPQSVSVNDATGDVYVLNVSGEGRGINEWSPRRVVCRFTSTGDAKPFPATGKPCLDGSATPQGAFGVTGFMTGSTPNRQGSGYARLADLEVNNSPSSTGDFYVQEDFGDVHAFSEDGEYLWTLSPPPAPSGFSSYCGMTVDVAGNLIFGRPSAGTVAIHENIGSPPDLAGEFPVTEANGRPCRVEAGHSTSEAHIAMDGVKLDHARPGGSVVEYVNGSYADIWTPDLGVLHPDSGFGRSAVSLASDRSKADGHRFAIYNRTIAGSALRRVDGVREYNADNEELSSSPHGAEFLEEGFGIAYNSDQDWVYVTDRIRRDVVVFGPLRSGPAPDVEMISATDVGQSVATVTGSLDPLGLEHRYYFEYRRASDLRWVLAGRSSADCLNPPSIPPDSAVEEITCEITGLRKNATYEVRLVAETEDPVLQSRSDVISFTTLPPDPPTLEDCVASEVGTTTAKMACELDGDQDEVVWRAETSTDPDCLGGFESSPDQTEPENAEPFAITWDFSGLLPSEDYCLQFRATNAGGPTLSEILRVETDPIPPSEVQTAFVGPRLDTSTRLNAYVNPHGAVVHYFFEIREEGGEWTALEEETNERQVRGRMVVYQEATSLNPETLYEYRVNLRNETDQEDPAPVETRAFVTRTAEEVKLIAPRAYELVNSPDKANQPVFGGGSIMIGAEKPVVREDGEKVIWTLGTGSPGSRFPTDNAFWSERTEDGWVSQAIEPDIGTDAPYDAFAAVGATEDFESAYAINLTRTGSGTERGVIYRVGAKGIAAMSECPPVCLPTVDFEATEDGEELLGVASYSGLSQLVAAGPDGVELVSVLPSGQENPCPVDTGHFVGGESQGGVSWHTGLRRSSTDGQRVAFGLNSGAGCKGGYGLFYRDRGNGITRAIDHGPADVTNGIHLIQISDDGERVYFTSRSQLEAGDENLGRDVYMWDADKVGSEPYECLTCVADDAQVSGGVQVARDESVIYFQSRADLAVGPAIPGEFNLYVLRDGEVRYVATPSGDMTLWGHGQSSLTTAAISDDGDVLVFEVETPTLVHQEVTGDVLGPCQTSQIELKCQQIYLYEAATESLECVSCSATGLTTRAADSGPRLGANVARPFDVSGDGSTVVFTTAETLVPNDINQAPDLYEWRNGVRRLITDGVTQYPEQRASVPRVRGLSADGQDVLFTVAAPNPLIGIEQDSATSFYNARIGGGFELSAGGGVSACQGDRCQGPVRAESAGLAASPSEAIAATENIKRPPRRRCARKKAWNGKACKRVQHGQARNPKKCRGQRGRKTRQCRDKAESRTRAGRGKEGRAK